MATQVQNRRGSTVEHSTFTGAVGEVTVDTDKEVVVVHDGTTAGGYPQMRENGSQNLVTTGSVTGGRFIPTSSTVPTNGVYLPAANSVAISTNGTGRLFVDATGKVTVNQATDGVPSINIESDNDGRSRTILRFTDTDAGTVANQPLGVIQFYGSDTSGAGAGIKSTIGAYSESTNGDSYLTFSTATSALNNQERLRITSAGLVGIGTSSPGETLQVETTNNNAIVLNSPANRYNSIGFQSAGTNKWWMGRADTDQIAGDAFFIGRDLGNAVDKGGNSASFVINSSGRVGIGTTSPDRALNVETSSGDAEIVINAQAGGAQASILRFRVGGTTQAQITALSSNLLFNTGASERARIDSSGRLLVGTSTSTSVSQFGVTPQIQLTGTSGSGGYQGLTVFNTAEQSAPNLVLGHSKGATVGTYTASVADDLMGEISFTAANGTDMRRGASIGGWTDAAWGTSDHPGRLVFSTTADGASSPTERMRISSDGSTLFSYPFYLYSKTVDGTTNAVKFDSGDIASSRIATTTQGHIRFFNGNGQVGQITTNGSATAYNTSSDYRLKENVTAVTDGIARLQQLKPSRFNFIADPDKTVDGFIAHEVQDVVPEAITGKKDAVDDEGNSQYQGIDQSKLVPLLTAALQEAVAKIESLEARLTAAGI